MNRKIEALARLAPAAFDAHNVLLVLKLTAQERLETCLAELTAALEQELVGASADNGAGRGGGSPLDIAAPGHKARGGWFGAGFGAAHFDAAFEATAHRYDGLFRGFEGDTY